MTDSVYPKDPDDMDLPPDIPLVITADWQLANGRELIVFHDPRGPKPTTRLWLVVLDKEAIVQALSLPLENVPILAECAEMYGT